MNNQNLHFNIKKRGKALTDIELKDLSKKINARDLEDLHKDKESLFFCDVEKELM